MTALMMSWLTLLEIPQTKNHESPSANSPNHITSNVCFQNVSPVSQFHTLAQTCGGLNRLMHLCKLLILCLSHLSWEVLCSVYFERIMFTEGYMCTISKAWMFYLQVYWQSCIYIGVCFQNVSPVSQFHTLLYDLMQRNTIKVSMYSREWDPPPHPHTQYKVCVCHWIIKNRHSIF
jgi:hypothetical protein